VEGTPRWLACGQVGVQGFSGHAGDPPSRFVVAGEVRPHFHRQTFPGAPRLSLVTAAGQGQADERIGDDPRCFDHAAGLFLHLGDVAHVAHVTDRRGPDRSTPLQTLLDCLLDVLGEEWPVGTPAWIQVEEEKLVEVTNTE